MTITGENELILHNILVGEVWLCSGQSNMEWPLSLSENAGQELLRSNYPKIRLFKVRKKAVSTPADDCTGNWDKCEVVTASGFSAVGPPLSPEQPPIIGTASRDSISSSTPSFFMLPLLCFVAYLLF